MSTPLVIIPRTITDDAELECTPAPEAGLGVDALQNSDRGHILRVLGDALSVTANLPQNRRLGGVIVKGHNLGAGATVRARIYDEEDLAGNLVKDTGTQPAVPAKTLGDLDWGIDTLGVALGNVDYSYLLFDNVVGRSLLLDVDDAGSTNIDINRLFVGAQLVPVNSYDFQSSLRWARESRRGRTAAGGLRVEASPRYREMTLRLSSIEDFERSRFAEMLRDTGSAAEVWVSGRTNSGGALEADYAMLAYLKEDPPMVREPSIEYSLNFVFEES